MDLDELNKAIKKVVDFDTEIEIYRFLKNEIPHIIKQYNMEQLFVDNIGADGIILGYYSKKTEEEYNSSKTAGTQYSMIDSGIFADSIKIEIKYRKISIFSTDPKIHDMLIASFYDTTEFFGLTDKNMNKLNRLWIIPFLEQKLTVKA